MIQVSTPKGQKKRCRVSVAGADRLSIIPKFDKSFTMTDEDDEDFEVSGGTTSMAWFAEILWLWWRNDG